MDPSVTVIANPASGRASWRKVSDAARRIEAMGMGVEVLYTACGGDATRLAREAALKNPRMVIAAGGDGTFNEVVNGLAGTDVPMAILPLGTTNVLASELGIPFSVQGAVDAALGRRPRAVSLGKVTVGGTPRYFSLMAGIGYDAATVRGVSGRMKRLIGKGAYALSGIKALLEWSPGELSVNVDGAHYRCYALIATNGEKYAGDFVIAPGADISEPGLNLLLFHGGGRADIIGYEFALLRERLHVAKKTTSIKGKDIDVRGESHVQVDGDYLGVTPASITTEPDALWLVY
jgi:YegS/Rv2252/BmrU family lipid kinase